MIYYGDEVCLWGANDPDCRKPMLWADKNYTNEFKNPDQSYRERPDKVYADESMLSFYRRLIKFRLAHEALTLGNFKMVLIEDEKQLYGYSRTYKDEAIYIVLNNNSAPQVATVKLPKNQTYWDLVSGETYETQYETRQFTIAAKNGIVLIRQIVPEKEEKGKAGTKK
jgi:glycosidase